MEPFPLLLGIIFSPSDRRVVAFGAGISWEVGPHLYAGGSHALSIELFHDISYFARVCFHFACARVCKCLDLGGGDAVATQNSFIGEGWVLFSSDVKEGGPRFEAEALFPPKSLACVLCYTTFHCPNKHFALQRGLG
eukprot:1152296-Pelagomonas_calceolata.AAC.2